MMTEDRPSIFLIIGSAVIGPIDAERVETPEQVAASTKMFNDHITRYNDFSATADQINDLRRHFDKKAGIRYETMAELCKRVMKDIGIEVEMKSSFVTFATIERDGKTIGAVGAWRPPLDAGEDWQVRCIEVPKGYRR